MDRNPSDDRAALRKLLSGSHPIAAELEALLSKLEDHEVTKYLAVCATADILIATTELRLKLLKKHRVGVLQSAMKLAKERRG